MSDSADILAYHRFLLYDTAERLDAYARALRAAVRPDSVVLDLGAGSAILSILAARAGARRVYAVERDDVASYAEELIAANGLERTITVIHGDAHSTTLPEPADVMVADIFGSFGLRPGGLAAVIDARDRLLRPRSRLIPDAIELFVAPAEAEDAFRECVDAWSADVEGVRFDALRHRAANTCHPVSLENAHLLGPAVRLDEVSLEKIRASGLCHSATLRIVRPGILRGFCGWFAASFGEGVRVSNQPGSNGLNYAQRFLPLPQPVTVAPDDTVLLRLDNRDNELLRWRGTIQRKTIAEPEIAFDQCTFLGSPLSKEIVSAAATD